MNGENPALLKRTLTDLEISEARYRRLFETARDGILILQAETGVIDDANPFLIDLLGYTRDSIVGKKLWEIGFFKDIKASKKAFKELQTKEYVRYEDLPLETEDGRTIDVEFISNVYMVDSKRVIQCNIRDITVRKSAEVAVRASLKEKEALLSELHHRVKNNLQIISSLLEMQIQKSKLSEVIAIFKKTQERIKVMAIIHQKLCESKDFMSIDISEYVNELVSSLFLAYGIEENTISVNVEAEQIFLEIDIVAPCGLIINELLTNAFKYAFPGSRKGTIDITLRLVTHDTIEIIVRDNGVGFPKGFDLRDTKSMGLALVVSTIETQLGGSITLDKNKKTQYTIVFKV
jgi:PAS domain S-box-containing protein